MQSFLLLVRTPSAAHHKNSIPRWRHIHIPLVFCFTQCSAAELCQCPVPLASPRTRRALSACLVPSACNKSTASNRHFADKLNDVVFLVWCRLLPGNLGAPHRLISDLRQLPVAVIVVEEG